MTDQLPDSLLRAFSQNRLIPIVGAGVSMALRSKEDNSLFPSWNQLLEIGADTLDKESKTDHAAAVRALVNIGKYQLAATELRESLVGTLWDDFFTDNFKFDETEIDESSLALAKSIWKLNKQSLHSIMTKFYQ